jgi:hypothetical protein
MFKPAIVLSTFFLSASAVASNVTLTFNELGSQRYIGSSYEANGLVITGSIPYTSQESHIGEFAVAAVAHPDGTSSPGLFFYGISGQIHLRASNGGLFNPASIELDESYAFRYGASENVTFVGTKADGTTVTAAHHFAMTAPTSETFVFGTAFNQITSLQWRQGAYGHTFDNLTVGLVGSVPEPSTLLLFSALIAALSCLPRKRAGI